MRKLFWMLLLLVPAIPLQAQTNKALVSGPWAGQVTHRFATIWLEVASTCQSVAVAYRPKGSNQPFTTVPYQGTLQQTFNPVKVLLGPLEPGTLYEYQLVLNQQNVSVPFATQFTTLALWQWRQPAPDFSFLAGSCNYVNEPRFDRPGKPYGGDSSLFETMANTPAQFNLWLGDNWYTREVDYDHPLGLVYRASKDRSAPVLQRFMASMPQYAIWDDHDYGPNDFGSSFIFKKESRQVFEQYWCNPSYGYNGEGVYTQFSHSDVDFFLTDDRYFRADHELPDSVNGQPNIHKTYFGREQLNWLKNALLASRATFKIIASGSQVLNPLNRFECMQQYRAEWEELAGFLEQHRISGVLFLTGDRHHSEVIRLERPGHYPLYDITSSPLTSGVARARGDEANNPYRIAGTLVEAQNFARITCSGPKNSRKLQVNFLGLKGEVLASWEVQEQELKSDAKK